MVGEVRTQSSLARQRGGSGCEFTSREVLVCSPGRFGNFDELLSPAWLVRRNKFEPALLKNGPLASPGDFGLRPRVSMSERSNEKIP